MLLQVSDGNMFLPTPRLEVHSPYTAVLGLNWIVSPRSSRLLHHLIFVVIIQNLSDIFVSF